MTRRTYIGLSLSHCVRDILLEKIKIEDISAIVSSTAFTDVEQAMFHYYIFYWDDFQEETVLFTLKKLWPYVMQPRLTVGMYEHRGHFLSKGHWLNTETGELSK